MGVQVELGYSALTRRDRLERIATAERDRREGRIDMAVAILGEPTEWPARAVLALARLPEGEGDATRRVLESGLDAWAEELGLDPLSERQSVALGDDLSFDALEMPTLGDVQDELDRPIEAFELDAAFEQAETQVDEMLDVNDVAEQVLRDEPLGLAEIAEDGVEATVDDDRAGAADPFYGDIFSQTPDSLDQVDAAAALDPFDISPRELASPSSPSSHLLSNAPESAVSAASPAAAWVSTEPDSASFFGEEPKNAQILATLEGWLHNLKKDPRRNAR